MSGNRVTCRDWFQLTLKEGLTVFRDQQFSADMNSAAVKRIEVGFSTYMMLIRCSLLICCLPCMHKCAAWYMRLLWDGEGCMWPVCMQHQWHNT